MKTEQPKQQVEFATKDDLSHEIQLLKSEIKVSRALIKTDLAEGFQKMSATLHTLSAAQNDKLAEYSVRTSAHLMALTWVGGILATGMITGFYFIFELISQIK